MPRTASALVGVLALAGAAGATPIPNDPFDSAGRIVTICVGLEGPRLAMFDPATLDLLAVFPLPPRSAGGGGVFSDFSGGGYFYLDDQDRAVIPTNSHQIWVVGETTTTLGPAFELVRVYDLA